MIKAAKSHSKAKHWICTRCWLSMIQEPKTVRYRSRVLAPLVLTRHYTAPWHLWRLWASNYRELPIGGTSAIRNVSGDGGDCGA